MWRRGITYIITMNSRCGTGAFDRNFDFSGRETSLRYAMRSLRVTNESRHHRAIGFASLPAEVESTAFQISNLQIWTGLNFQKINLSKYV